MYLEKRSVQYALLLFMAFIWGSSFILMKTGLKSFDSNQAAAIRIASASIVLLPLSIYHLRKLKWKDLRSILIAGYIGSFLPAFLFTKAQTHIDSAMAGMLNSLTPMFTLFIGLIFYKIEAKKMQYVGLFVALCGALGLIGWGKGLDLSEIDSYALLIVLATLFYGISMNEIKSRLSHYSGIETTSFIFIFLLPAAIGYLLTTNLTPALANEGWGLHLAALITLGVVGTAFTLILMNSLIRYTAPIFVSSTTYIIPIFAIGWGLLDGETIEPVHLIFMALILTGVYLINTKGKIRIVAHVRMLARRKP